ncbi:hypothetical protein GO303_04368 [Ralstonia solanacearum]|nr:hypothetical protein [Ralstonia solanacearum]
MPAGKASGPTNAWTGDHHDDLDRPALHRRARARQHGSPGAGVAGGHGRLARGRRVARPGGPGGDCRAGRRAGAARPAAHAQAAAPRAGHAAGTGDVPRDPAGDVANRARRHRSRHGVVGCRTVLRPPRLETAARGPGATADAGGASLPRRRDREAVRPRQRLGEHAGLAGPVARSVGLCQAGRLPRHDHPQGIRRQRVLGLCALAGGDEAGDALFGGGGVGDGAELAGPGRAAAALRHRRAEGLLPAAPGARRGDPLLRADQRLRRLGRRRHPRCGRGLPRPARGPRDARPARDLEQALYHARADRDGAGAGLPRGRSGRPAGRRQGARHHLRADPDAASGRQHRPPPLAAQRGVPERPELGQGCVHPDRLGDRRAGAGGARLAHADGMPGGGPRDLAAVVQRRDGQAGGARDRRLCRRAPAVPHAHRAVRGHPGGAGPHGRQPLHDGCGTPAVGAGGGPGREAVGHLRHGQVPRHRARPRRDQRCHGHRRRQGHLHGAEQLPGARVPADSDRHHGGGRQHHDALPDHLRPGRDPLPPVRAARDDGRARRRFAREPARLRRGAVRPRRLRRRQPGACAAACAVGRARDGGAIGCRAGAAPLLSGRQPLLDRAGAAGRCVDVHAGRHAQAPREPHRTAG